MSKPILIIDPGHGGKDPGGGSNTSFKEKDINLNISLYQFNRFKDLGLPVAITRISDIFLDSENRTKIVRESGARYCISNHINAAENLQVRGVETIHSIFTDDKLAKILFQAIVDEGITGRRVFSKESEIYNGKDYYYMHRDTGAVNTIIVEYGFATNAEDAKLIESNWRNYGEAVVKAFCTFINHKYTPPATNTPPKEGKFPIIKSGAKVEIDGQTIPAYITDEGRTVVEVRNLAELLNLEIEWDASNRTVILKRR